MPKKLRAHLSQFLSPTEIATVSTSYDIVGDIVVLRPLSENNVGQTVAAEIMNIHRNIKTVLSQQGKVAGNFRIRSFSHLAGEDRKTTFHRESGCVFSVDLEKCYFSPRLGNERLRISKLVKSGETVVNMFAGMGCFSIVIAKQARSNLVFSIDINPEAIALMRENIRLNAVYGKVIPLLGDSEEVVRQHFQGMADRVLMPLPEKAFEYMPAALSALKPTGGWLHLYDFQHATKHEDPLEKTKARVAEKASHMRFKYEHTFSRVVRSIGPNWYQTVLDMRVLPFPGKS